MKKALYMAENDELNTNEWRLIDHLRHETENVKSCVVTFSFQTITLAGVLLTAIFATMGSFPIVCLAAFPIVVMLMNVTRIAIFKYQTANRNCGYELHLARVRTIEKKNAQLWKPQWKEIHWEEALRAWRIVQVALFRKIYVTPETTKLGRFLIRTHFSILKDFWPGFYHYTRETREMIKNYHITKNKSPLGAYPWFSPTELTRINNESENRSFKYAKYHAGQYLHTTLNLIFFMQILMSIPLLITIFRLFFTTFIYPTPTIDDHGFSNITFFVLYSLALIVLLVIIILNTIRSNRRRKILENELLSIHSCAITWQAVITAHFKVLESSNGYEHYTESLTKESRIVEKYAFQIHEYLSHTNFQGDKNKQQINPF